MFGWLEHWSIAPLMSSWLSYPSSCSEPLSDGQCLWPSANKPAVEKQPKLNNPKVQIRWLRWPVWWLNEVGNILSAGTQLRVCVFRSVWQAWQRTVPPTWNGFQLRNKVSNLCLAFWCKHRDCTTNGSNVTICKTLYDFFLHHQTGTKFGGSQFE